ncbi:MAG: agmatinase [Candidatus Nanohaloarchaea archaeon]|jgi:agmatinase
MTKTNTPSEAELVIQKLPSDIGIHRNPRKGTLNAPEVLLENFEIDKSVLVEDVFLDEFDLEESHRTIEENTNSLTEYGKPILSVGGDHSVSFPVIKALKQKYPDLQLVWLDSHLDVKQKVDDHVSHDVVVRELLEHGFSEHEIYIVGVTRIDEDEENFLEKHDLNIYRHDEIEKFLREFKPGEQPVYLSVDIDVLKEEIAPGTGYPDGELNLKQAKQIINTVKPDFADLVEVAPPFDTEGRTVSSGRDILEWLADNMVEEAK